MDIRSVTLFCTETNVSNIKTVSKLTNLSREARNSFPYPVQSTRVATPPFPDWWPTDPTDAQAVSLHAQQIEQQLQQTINPDYISFGPVQLKHNANWLHAIPAIIASSKALFATTEIADQNGRIDLTRCQNVAQLIQQLSKLEEHPHGFGNVYHTAIANCPPGSPFFPVSYHHGGDPHFAIAVESADIALNAIQSANTLAEARQNLITAIETAASQISQIAQELSQKYSIPFSGIDFSLAPYPEDEKSLGGAMEALGIPHVGAAGTLFAAGFITEAIERANFARCGFSGLMLSVLEDSVLARRAAEGRINVQDLLTYSAVCGVGLDTIPLAGDIAEEVLTAVFLDTAMLASRLKKPLTARLMPIPNLNVGDATQYTFPYFANSHTMPLVGNGITGLMNNGEQISINKINKG